MSIYVTEHTGINNYRQPINQQISAAYNINSTVSASPGPFPQAGTRYIRVSADVGTFLNLNSASTGITLTSTNSYRIPANAAPELFSVSTAFRIQAAST